jgi:hypothetical protein
VHTSLRSLHCWVLDNSVVPPEGHGDEFVEGLGSCIVVRNSILDVFSQVFVEIRALGRSPSIPGMQGFDGILMRRLQPSM